MDVANNAVYGNKIMLLIRQNSILKRRCCLFQELLKNQLIQNELFTQFFNFDIDFQCYVLDFTVLK